MFGWGEFLKVVINFLILAFIIFLIVRQAGKMFKTEEKAPAPEPEAIALLRENCDVLKKKNNPISPAVPSLRQAPDSASAGSGNRGYVSAGMGGSWSRKKKQTY